MSPPGRTSTRAVSNWRAKLVRRIEAGERFAGVFATVDGTSVRLTAALASAGRTELLDATLPPGLERYPALTPQVPSAFWYERELHDLCGVVPDGHPRLDPLVLPLTDADPRPRPGASQQPPALTPHETPLPPHLAGTGLFTLPHGPVRSGAVESVEFLIETPGEDIPHLRVRPHHKHRGLAKRFEQLSVPDGLLLAERVEGIASVAHALAYAQAVEDLAGIAPPRPASLVRVVHAELERIANHLDVAMRLADAAALAVATARFGWHKERVLRLRSELGGSRFGRGVIAIGGVHCGLGRELGRPGLELSELGRPGLELSAMGRPGLELSELGEALAVLEHDIAADERAAMATASFLDRLRGTGRLPVETAAEAGALGPIGRASATGPDVRRRQPYAAYAELGVEVVLGSAGDVQERLRVRWAELHESFRLIRAALKLFDAEPAPAPRKPLPVPDGRGVGCVEAPQGELLYIVEVADGRLSRVIPRSASFHNLPLLHRVFAGDIFTDFPFIEASFGVSIAGVAG
ncbi:MAG: hydrogenase large subunit [Mycobacteriales bacterium]